MYRYVRLFLRMVGVCMCDFVTLWCVWKCTYVRGYVCMFVCVHMYTVYACISENFLYVSVCATVRKLYFRVRVYMQRVSV